MISREQAETVSTELIGRQKEQAKKSSRFKWHDNKPRKYRMIGLFIGGVLGALVSWLWHGSIMPGQGLGMMAGALAGGYFDGWRQTKAIFWLSLGATAAVLAIVTPRYI